MYKEEHKMGPVEEKIKVGSLVNGTQTKLLEQMKFLKEIQDHSGTRRTISSELWYACAGPLVSLPQVGSLVYYFPQGHSEQVAVSTRRKATSQVPNYPNLPSQLLCQVHNVTLDADKDTDEIYAQMSLQPVNSEKDVFPVPNFGRKSSRHPSEFFCKTLTASDTSTHGGFSVPRRAAEKLFPPLDYTMQPPTQELVVRDLYDNSWTFRHIYRGQPKRHLLTSGWSLFVGSKRLKAGDSVLFIRGEKSQLMVGVRRSNRQQTTLPSSVLSADSMHIGVLAAAAHAAAKCSPFTIFYNPRACPSEFVIPLAKFRKAVYGTQVSVGMRLGMMFETEDSSKRRYMGTIVGLSDIDPLRWSGSKWRNLQVEWDEPGCSDKKNRVSSWEIETPESLFTFPSLTSSLKRPISEFLGGETEWGNVVKRSLWLPENSSASFPYSSISNLSSDRLLKMFMKPQVTNYPGTYESTLNEFCAKGAQNQTPDVIRVEKLKPEPEPEPEHSADQLSQVTATEDCMEKPSFSPPHSHNTEKEVGFQNPNQAQAHDQTSVWPVLEPSGLDSHRFHIQQADSNVLNFSLPFLDTEEWIPNSSCLTLPGIYGLQTEAMNMSMPMASQDLWDHQLVPFAQQDPFSLSSSGGKGLSSESNDQSGIYVNVGNRGSFVTDPSVSNSILDEFCTSKDGSFQKPPDCLLWNFSSSQDVQSQITSVSLGDSQAFSSGGTSSSNVDFEKGHYMNTIAPRVRTYTKVQKAGSVGRSIDVSRVKNYEELCLAMECMFGLDGLLNNHRESGWKLVYVDYENDVLLVGDDPWEEFVGCVRCIRILSPTEVQQMGEEGMKLLNNANIKGLTASVADGNRA